jgi:aryl-alcohol dehydrogenase-like predicted oxidoreductase
MRQRGTVRVDLPAETPLDHGAFFAKTKLHAGAAPSPRLGVGTAGLGGVWGEVDRAESVGVLHDAWRRGFLLADSSPNYNDGRSEEVLGEALRGWNGPAPVVCTKIEGWGDLFVPRAGETWRDAMERQFQQSVTRFGGRRLDGLAMHDAEHCEPAFTPDCERYLMELEDSGKVGCMGMGGGGPEVQLPALRAFPGRFRYVITYLRLNAITLQALTDLAPECRRQGVAVIAASPVFMGLLGSQYEVRMARPPAHLAPVLVGRAREIKALADRASLPLSQLALRFLLSMPAVHYVLTGANNAATWADTLAAYEAGPLPAELYADVWRTAQSGGEEPIIGG